MSEKVEFPNVVLIKIMITVYFWRQSLVLQVKFTLCHVCGLEAVHTRTEMKLGICMTHV